jgi:hypothetical protein
MMILSRIFFFAAALCLASFSAQAEGIIWKQPSTMNTYHENLNFEGNATLYPSDVRKLQRALADRGFYKGRIDGIWGGQTSQAILDYQAVHQQALTGTVTKGTLRDLGVFIDEDRYR